jgi:hypothetical protein
MDRGKISKQKKTSMSAFDHLMEKKERQDGKSLNARVKWT